MREKKKRGKASRKDLAERAAAQAAATSGGHNGDVSDSKESSNSPTAGEDRSENGQEVRQASISSNGLPTVHENGVSSDGSMDADFHHHHHDQTGTTPRVFGEMPEQPHISQSLQMNPDNIGGNRGMHMGSYNSLSASYDRQSLGSDDLMGGETYSHQHQHHHHHHHQNNIQSYPDMSFSMLGQSPTDFNTAAGGFRLSSGPMNGYPLTAATPPGWAIPMNSPPGQFQTHMQHANFGQSALRYPVLEPLLSHLTNIIPVHLACDLIDVYFASSSSAQMHPMSPYILGFVFRKRAFLHPTKPRKCQPALLASMLWVAAQTSEASLLTSVPSARGKICQKLLELTVGLLRPLIHNSSADAATAATQTVGAVALGGLGVPLPGSMSMDALTGESGAFGASGQLDDLVTYIHLATVVSASEYKGASLRWWNVAWSLARELKLGRELPPSEPPTAYDPNDIDSEGLNEHDVYRNSPGYVTEEEREERRRIWWLVYTVDRHLALCYNRPLFLLDVECEGLRQPMDDVAWQAGDFKSSYSADSAAAAMLSTCMIPEDERVRDYPLSGPQFECRGFSIFGYFLPLMTILGEIVDLHHAKNHPRFGSAFRASREWENQVSEVRRHLEAYEASLKRFEARHISQNANTIDGSSNNNNNSNDKNGNKDENGGTGLEGNRQQQTDSSPSALSVHTTSSRITEVEVQTKIVIAYGTHVMHVLHILLDGKWDPINLLDDEDLWISSPGFVTATQHAVAAADAISQILEYDSGLEFMPFFFGVYLLQGSFLLLLIADKLGVEASSNVVRACETIVRAHDACVVTLSTEYQVCTYSFQLLLHFFCYWRLTFVFTAQIQQSHAWRLGPHSWPCS